MKAFAVDVIVTDIEGTTSSLAFVKDVLFPYAQRHIREFVSRREGDLAAILDEVRQVQGDDSLSTAQVIEALEQWMAEDRKIGPLKALQGMMWAEGYASGELVGHVYPDAVEGLSVWRDAGVRLYVYSSGSTEAQQLIFRHTRFGDLTPLFSGYFDTRIGGKQEAVSYQRIAGEIGVAAHRILFLSDHAGEIAAAAQSGWQTQLVDRDARTGGAVATFNAITVERAA